MHPSVKNTVLFVLLIGALVSVSIDAKFVSSSAIKSSRLKRHGKDGDILGGKVLLKRETKTEDTQAKGKGENSSSNKDEAASHVSTSSSTTVPVTVKKGDNGNEKIKETKTPSDSSDGLVKINKNCTSSGNNGSNECDPEKKIMTINGIFENNSGMLFRAMYVLLGVTAIVVVYFTVRAVRLRRRRSKSRKYGIISQKGDHGDLEMEPLGDGDDEDDDYTVFEMNERRNK